MIRLLNRKLIIPRGDTGTFSVPVLPNLELADQCSAFFTIFNPQTQQRLLQKQAEINGQLININISHNDTVSLKAGTYYWDIRFWKNPVVVDDVIVDGTEVHSYYAAYALPQCEIRQTGEDFPQIDNNIEKLNLLSSAVTETQQSAAAAYENLEQIITIKNNIDLFHTNVFGNIQETNIASKPYAVNNFIILNNNLYRILATVNTGEELVEGQNIEKTTITDICSNIYNYIASHT